MSKLDQAQRDYLEASVLAYIVANPDAEVGSIYLFFSYDALYPVGVIGSPNLAPDPFAPDQEDVMEAIVALQSAQDIVPIDRAPTVERQKYRVR